MPCKQSDLITAINSFAAARASSDQVLTNFSANLVAKLLDTLVFDPEEVPEDEQAPAAVTPEGAVTTEVVSAPPVEEPTAPVLKAPPVKKTKKRSSARG